MSTIDLTTENFNQTIEDNEIVLIDFWAGWCGPCKTFTPIYEELSESHPDLVFAKVDTESQREIAAGFQIRSIPTLIVFKEQIVVFSQAGVLPRGTLEKLVSGVRELDMDEVRASIEKKRLEKNGESPEGS